jgi:hypothetical protein
MLGLGNHAIITPVTIAVATRTTDMSNVRSVIADSMSAKPRKPKPMPLVSGFASSATKTDATAVATSSRSSHSMLRGCRRASGAKATTVWTVIGTASTYSMRPNG